MFFFYFFFILKVHCNFKGEWRSVVETYMSYIANSIAREANSQDRLRSIATEHKIYNFYAYQKSR